MNIAEILSKTKWQKCIRCSQEVLTISSPDTALCGGDHCIEDEIEEKSVSYKKERIPDEIRWAVWERDNFTCKKCGTRKNLTVDHIFPETKGGKATLDNCQTLCNRCNSSKGAR
jgi:hypothetical protein